MMRSIIFLLVVAFCTFTFDAVFAHQQDSFENAGVRFLLKIYDECSNSDGFSPCLKKKAVSFLDRASRMNKIALMEGVNLIRSTDAETSQQIEPQVTENEIEYNLPRNLENQDDVLNKMLTEKVSNLLGTRTIEISMPKVSELLEEGRGKGGGGGGNNGGGGKKGMGMMGGMMMAVAAKMAALIPIAIAGLFLLAGKALITAKIALLISGIIAIKKLFASKHHEEPHVVHAHPSGGGGGGWQPHPSEGGWGKRSLNGDAQILAYNAYDKSSQP